MLITGLNHLAFITNDMTRTIRFYRDLLGMELACGIGRDGYRHYFFRMGSGCVAFFEYEEAQPMERIKFHGERTDRPIGFDHVAFAVASKEDLFRLKDRLEAAGVDVTGVVDHGTVWSIYFFDPNNIPLEASWDCLELLRTPAIADDDPLPAAEEGAGPQPGLCPEVTRQTPTSRMVARPGNGHAMRASFVARGLARPRPGLEEEAGPSR